MFKSPVSHITGSGKERYATPQTGACISDPATPLRRIPPLSDTTRKILGAYVADGPKSGGWMALPPQRNDLEHPLDAFQARDIEDRLETIYLKPDRQKVVKRLQAQKRAGQISYDQFQRRQRMLQVQQYTENYRDRLKIGAESK